MKAGLSLHPIFYCLIFAVPFGIISNFHEGGWNNFTTPVAVFLFAGLLDIILGVNKYNPGKSDEKKLSERKIYRYLTWACAPVQVGTVIWAAYMVSKHPLTLVEFTGLALSVGIMSGVMGINVAHEMIHRVNNKFEPFLGNFMLMSVFYMHWGLEHVAGHHKNVATPIDPATSKLGQSFYQFWPQTVFGSFISAWHIEEERFIKKGLPTWSASNRIIRYMVVQILFVLALWWLFSFKSVAFFFLQAFFGVSLLEAVNYLEHYGLERKFQENGKYERTRVHHAWNASNWISNYALFNLQRHGDHHENPGKRYQNLIHFDDSPQLPTGYAGMVPVALIPPLWFAIMDKRVKWWREKYYDRKPESKEPRKL